MNYRALFLVSILIIVIGLFGLWMMPSGTEETTDSSVQTTAPPEEAPKNEKVIMVAQINRDINQGTLLQAGDYVLNELKVTEDSPLVANDLKPMIETSKVQGLQGYVIAESVKSGSFLSPNTVVSPEDPRFLKFTLDPKQEVAYRIYVKAPERYLLDTLSSGEYVSIYSQQQDPNSQKMNLFKVLDHILVLQVNTFNQTDENDSGAQNDIYSRDHVGYISIKTNASNVKNFYALDREAKLIALPSYTKDDQINYRGVYIRKLRGQQ